MGNVEYFEGPLRALWYNLPYFVALIAGLILVIIFFRRARRAARLALLAIIVALVVRAGWPFLIESVYMWMARDTAPYWFIDFFMRFGVWFARSLEAACWLLLVIAAVAWRTSPTEQSVTGVTSAMQDDAPPVRPATPWHAPPVKPASKGFYLVSIFGSLVLTWVLLIPALILLSDGGSDEAAAAMALTCAAYLPLIYMVVIIAVLVHRMWAAIRGGSPRTTPGKAVGFLFIPLFNFYWIFQAYHGWTVDYNRLVSDNGIRAPRAPEGLALALCILALCSLIPFLGILAALVNAVLLAIFFNAAINGINAIAAATENN